VPGKVGPLCGLGGCLPQRDPGQVVTPDAVYREIHEDDQRLSRVGILFCCTISILVFGVALLLLPIRRTLPGELEQVGQAVNPNGPGKLLTLTPVPTVSVVPTSTRIVSNTPMTAPLIAASPMTRASSPARTPTPARNPVANAQTYTVQSGDTLYGIARREGISPQALAVMNGVPADKLIKAGEKLRVA